MGPSNSTANPPVNDLARAYLQQARSDLRVFEMLASADRAVIPECHPLHYFQMATEKLAKAALLSLGLSGFDRFGHVAFSLLPCQLARNDIARALGWRNATAYRQFLRKAAPLFRRIDELSPSVGMQVPDGGALEGPNVEYPWRGRDSTGAVVWHVPASTRFGLLEELRRSRQGASVLHFVRTLLDRYDAIFK